jgi:hypothetical protein
MLEMEPVLQSSILLSPSAFYMRSVLPTESLGLCSTNQYILMSVIPICRIWGSNSSSHESCHIVGYGFVLPVSELTFRGKVSSPFSGSKIRQARNEGAAGGKACTAQYPRRWQLS